MRLIASFRERLRALSFIRQARDWWRFWSVRLTMIGSALQALLTTWPDTALVVWNGMPGEVKALLPQSVVAYVPLGIFAAAIVARVLRQPNLPEASDGAATR